MFLGSFSRKQFWISWDNKNWKLFYFEKFGEFYSLKCVAIPPRFVTLSELPQNKPKNCLLHKNQSKTHKLPTIINHEKFHESSAFYKSWFHFWNRLRRFTETMNEKSLTLDEQRNSKSLQTFIHLMSFFIIILNIREWETKKEFVSGM